MASNDLYLRSDSDKGEASPDKDLRLRSDVDKALDAFIGDVTQDQEPQEQEALGEVEIAGFYGTVDQVQEPQDQVATGRLAFLGNTTHVQEPQDQTTIGELAFLGNIIQAQESQDQAGEGGQLFSGVGSTEQENQDQSAIGGIVFVGVCEQEQEIQVQQAESILAFIDEIIEEQELQDQSVIGEVEIFGFSGIVDHAQEPQIGNASGWIEEIIAGFIEQEQQSQVQVAQGIELFIAEILQLQQIQNQDAIGEIEELGGSKIMARIHHHLQQQKIR